MTRRPGTGERLWTYAFTVLTLASAFGFCNIAIFYGFASYLERLGVDPFWRGGLLGAEPLAAFILRPFLSVWVTRRNALALVRLSLVGMGLALCCYSLVAGVPALFAVRVFHGLSFVCLVSGVITLLSGIIPKALSGRAFSYFSLSSLVPYALMPPLVEWLLPRVGNEAAAYAWSSLLTLPALALLAPLGRRLGRAAPEFSDGPGTTAGPGCEAVGARELLANVGRPEVALLLGANLFVILSSTLIFFYMKPYALRIGLADPGLFFTVCTGASIAMRLAAGRFYDRASKPVVLALSLAALAGCMFLFARGSGQGGFLVLAGFYGLCLGAAMPLLNALMFERSAPRLRPGNMNLMLFTMDAGYVLGPATGGAFLAAGAGYPALFGLCAVCAAAACLLVLGLVFGPGAAGRRKG